jgi:hypothetical protein
MGWPCQRLNPVLVRNMLFSCSPRLTGGYSLSVLVLACVQSTCACTACADCNCPCLVPAGCTWHQMNTCSTRVVVVVVSEVAHVWQLVDCIAANSVSGNPCLLEAVSGEVVRLLNGACSAGVISKNAAY